MYQIVAAQKTDTIVGPFGFLLQVFKSPNVHIRTEHQIAGAIVLPEQIGIARSTLDACMFEVTEDGVAIQQIVVVEAVATECIGCPCSSLVVHVAEQIAIVSLLTIAVLPVARFQISRQGTVVCT